MSRAESALHFTSKSIDLEGVLNGLRPKKLKNERSLGHFVLPLFKSIVYYKVRDHVQVSSG